MVAGHWQLLLLTAAIFALWPTRAVIPLKILIVFLHELSHALATLLTGGRVESLTISPDQGGMVVSLGGNRFVTLSAGYVGSLVIGVGLLVAAIRSRADRVVMGLLAAMLMAVTVLYIRDAFALAFGAGTAVTMLGAAWFLGHGPNDLILRVIGLASMIYVPYDIVSDTILRAHLRSDAWMLADEFGGPTLFWGVLWLAVSLLVIALTLRHALGRDSNLDWRRADQSS